MHTTTRPALATPDAADELAAGRPFPHRDATRPLDSITARELLTDQRAWWLDVAADHVRVAGLARADGAMSTVDELLSDAQRALDAAAHLSPKRLAVPA